MSKKHPSIIIASNGYVYCDTEHCEVSKLFERTLCGNCEGRKCPLTDTIRYVAKGVATGIGASLAQNLEENLNIIINTLGNGTSDISEQQEH